jgi:ABC-2 type transport system permease protein
MGASLLLARKDFLILFRSPLAYVIMFCFLVISGYFFVSSVGYYQLWSISIMQSPQAGNLSLHDMLIMPFLQNAGVILLFFIPLLTMRGFSEEKRSGAFELLMSYPVSETSLALGKLFSLAGLIAATLVFSMIGPAMLFLYISPEIGPLLIGYAGLFLMALGFVSLGLFLSSLTENQIVAASLTFAALLILWLVNWSRDIAPQAFAPVVDAISLLTHFEPFSKGVLTVADAAYYVCFIVLFMWLTVLSLENQRWRG